jgi:hypothetical protein
MLSCFLSSPCQGSLLLRMPDGINSVEMPAVDMVRSRTGHDEAISSPRDLSLDLRQGHRRGSSGSRWDHAIPDVIRKK